jgi:hypothetical protein
MPLIGIDIVSICDNFSSQEGSPTSETERDGTSIETLCARSPVQEP